MRVRASSLFPGARRLRRFTVPTLYALTLGTLLTTPACTVIPKPVHDRAASFDGNDQNSGLLSFNENGSAVITPHARARYNLLVDTYGPRFAPPLVHDYGITPSPIGQIGPTSQNYTITAEALADFAKMVRWAKGRDGE